MEAAMEQPLALILAGGRGKRMDILCSHRPKPALPFAGNFRVIDFSLNNCIHSRIADVGVLVDYQRKAMADYLAEWHARNGKATRLRVLPPTLGSYLGTADAVYQNLGYLESQAADTVLVLAGDHVYKMDYRRLIAFHRMANADVTVGVVRVPAEETHRFGIVSVDTESRIRGFVEKSSRPNGNLASMGIYVFRKDLLIRRLSEDAAEAGSPHDFGYAVLPRMVRQDRVYAYEFDGYWQDIGTMDAYYEANMELLRERPGYSLDSDWPVFYESDVLPAYVRGGEGNVTNSVVSPGCIIKGTVENSVLSPGVRVDEQAVVKNSVVMPRVTIGYHSVVDRCILEEGVHIGRFCYIGFGAGSGKRGISVLGSELVIPDHTAIGHTCKVTSGADGSAFKTGIIPSGTTLVV
jgi:glucose-1-phosphate adenylyltransferase